MDSVGGTMKILAIDTSCDETAAAVTEGTRVLSNIIWSQASQHARWGGVVPSLAKRLHAERIGWVIKKALQKARNKKQKTDTVAVTVGPGLAPALEVGIAKAKELALEWNVPLIPVNHLEGHVASAFVRPHESHEAHEAHVSNAFALIVSGGHTQLILSDFSNPSFPSHHLLASTLDDALGEALDKVARMLGLGYPGGAVLEKFAKEGDPKKYKLPLPLLGRENQGKFSFSGLKTAFYRLVEGEELNRQEICDLAASFQNTAFEHLIRVISRTIKKETLDFLIGGGVAANIELRKRLRKFGRESRLKIHFPYSKKLCTDNAAMIGLAAQWAWARGEAKKTRAEIESIDRLPNLNFPLYTLK